MDQPTPRKLVGGTHLACTDQSCLTSFSRQVSNILTCTTQPRENGEKISHSHKIHLFRESNLLFVVLGDLFSESRLSEHLFFNFKIAQPLGKIQGFSHDRMVERKP